MSLFLYGDPSPEQQAGNPGRAWAGPLVIPGPQLPCACSTQGCPDTISVLTANPRKPMVLAYLQMNNSEARIFPPPRTSGRSWRRLELGPR